MTLLPAFMLILTLTVLITVGPRIVFAWQQFRELAANEDREGLLAMLHQENEWVLRHFVCAISGTALVALMETMPSINPPEYLSAVITAYVLMSFTFALTESLLALKIAPLAQNCAGRAQGNDIR